MDGAETSATSSTRAPATGPPIGTVITKVGNYELSKTIGKGQFGSVKLGIHNITGERVRVCCPLYFAFFFVTLDS